MLKAIHAQENKQATIEKTKAVVAELKVIKLPKSEKNGKWYGRNIDLL